MTSKQKRRSPSFTGRTVQMRKSSSITENESSLLRFLQFESKSLQSVTQQQHKTFFSNQQNKKHTKQQYFFFFFVNSNKRLINKRKISLFRTNSSKLHTIVTQ